ncbi:MAG: HAD family hydrolase [Candidatus Thorarchaeota archaeon]
MLEAVFFDFGNTLASPKGYTILDVNQFFTIPELRKLGVKTSKKEIMQIIEEVGRNSTIPLRPTKSFNSSTPFMKYVIDRLEATHITTEQARDLEYRGYQQHMKIVKLYPWARKALEWIKQQGLQLALISNFYQDLVKAYLEALHVFSFFDTIITSERARALKAELRPFKLALKELKVTPQGAIHVGDSIEQDGACRKLGIKFIYSTWHQIGLQKRAVVTVSPKDYDFTAANYRELIRLIKTLI